MLVIAGCFSKGRPDFEKEEQQVAAAALPILVQDHGDARGHFDAAAHQAAWNVEPVAYSNGVDDSGDANKIPAGGAYNEMAVTDDYVYLSRGSADGSFGGFIIIALNKDRDGAPHPSPVGEFLALGGGDIEVSDDEELVFFATQRNMPEQIVGSILNAEDPTAGLPRGIYTVDVRDKTNPVLASFLPLPLNGPHTITYVRHPNGSEYLIACTYDLLTDPGTGAVSGAVPVTQRVLIYQIVRTPLPNLLQAVLVPITQYQIAETPPAGKLYIPHDTRVQAHPFDGRTLLYVAYWDKGVRILDFTTPPLLLPLDEVGFANDFAPSKLGNIHLAQPFEQPIDGLHVTVAEPEIITAPEETGQITFFDTSDPTRPAKLGSWTLPPGPQGQLGVSNFDFSPHNFDTWDGRVALAHQHAGVWIIDVSDEQNLESPRSVGFYMPAVPRNNSPALQPSVWGVFENDGLLYAADAATGLYVLRYTGP